MIKKYSTIVFDLGNVLLPFDHGLWIKNYNKIEIGLGDKYYKKYLDNPSVHMDYESGLMSDKDFIEVNCNWLENKVSKKEFRYIFSNMFTTNTKVVELLPILKEKYKLVLLSNTNNIHTREGWSNNSFLNYFEKLILSHEVKSLKPNEEIYRAVEKYTNQPPESHVFIDDIKENADAAITYGWDSIHFTGYEKLVEGFRLRNILQ